MFGAMWSRPSAYAISMLDVGLGVRGSLFGTQSALVKATEVVY